MQIPGDDAVHSLPDSGFRRDGVLIIRKFRGQSAANIAVRGIQNIQQLIWNKLFTNVSLSAVTAVLQVKMGYIAANPYAWKMTGALLHEAVEVAHALGLEADEEELLAEVRHVSEMSPEGVTSICADLSHGRRTEVDTISGSVVRAAAKAGVPVPSHEFIVNMIHAMEQREQKG